MITIRCDQGLEEQSNHLLDTPTQLFAAEPDRQDRRAWFKRPSIAWIVCTKTLGSLAFGIALGPRIEIFTDIVCRRYYYDRLIEDVPRIFGRCTGDPRVQAEVARVSAIFAIISGALSILTAGWWGGLMDRYGRTRVLSMVVIVPLLREFLFLLVFFCYDKIPGGYWFLIITPIVEGLLGYWAAESAYVYDVSEPHNLARNFTFLSGIFYMSSTIGPLIGGFLNERSGSVITALYATSTLHVAHACIVWFALPESGNEASMIHARNQFAHELASAANADVNPFRRRLMVFTKTFWDSFPLHVLMPKRHVNAQWRRDWNLTLLALSVALIALTRASVGDIFQYTLYTFGWSSLQLSYLISANGLTATVFLLVILPVVVWALKRAPSKLQHAEDAKSDTMFDLRILRVSSLIFTAGYALMALAPTGFIFALCFMTASFGQGFFPFVQGVATVLYTNASGDDNVGRLLSAFGVVYNLSGGLFGPLIFGTIFSTTVSFFPTAMFWTSFGFALVAFLLLAFIRLPSSSSTQDVERQDGFTFRDDRSANSELEPLLGY